MPNPQEVATLTVNGRDYKDWTSVTVENHITQAFPIFQFECTEFTPAGSERTLSPDLAQRRSPSDHRGRTVCQSDWFARHIERSSE